MSDRVLTERDGLQDGERADLNARQLAVYAREFSEVYWAERRRTRELAAALAREQDYQAQLQGAGAAVTRADARVREATSGLITALAVALDQRDPYTEGHSQRVAAQAVWTGLELGLAVQQLEVVAYAAKSHDLGKISMPDELLRKPGRFTEDEWETMREHPQRGVEIMSVLAFTPAAVVESIGQHHERLDGSGYPAGLRGDQICLGARIIAVADSFDAITTARAYRASLPHDQAFVELRACSGHLLDGDVVAALERAWRQHN